MVSSLMSVLVMIFLDLTPKEEPKKVKISKWDYIKLEHICIAKEITNKIKRFTKEKNMLKIYLLRN